MNEDILNSVQFLETWWLSLLITMQIFMVYPREQMNEN